MKRLRCCLPNCTATGMTQHKFPNPRTHHALFLKWLEILNMGELRVLDPDVLYVNKRLCFSHFEAKHKSSGNPRLHVLEVPSLNLPRMVQSAADPIPSTSAATDAAPDINILNIILGTTALADPIPSKSAAGVPNAIISTPTTAVTPEI